MKNIIVIFFITLSIVGCAADNMSAQQQATNKIKLVYKDFDSRKVKKYLIQLNKTNPAKAESLNNANGWVEIWHYNFAKIDNNFMEQYAIKLASVLPKRTNKYSTMSSAVLVEDEIIIGIKTTLEINQKLINKSKIKLDNEWCNEDFVKNKILKSGYNFTNVFYGKDNRKLGENTTTYKDCIKSDASIKYRKFLDDLTDDEFINFNSTDKRYDNIETDRLGNVEIGE